MANEIKAVNRENINALKWNADFIKRMGLIEEYDDNTIPMWVADMDLRIAEPIEKALVKAATQGSFGYTTTLGDSSYVEACQQYFKRRYDYEVEAKKIFMAPGTLHTINASLKVFTKEGDGIIIQRPVYTQFTTQIESTKRVVKDNHLILKDGEYHIDFANLEELAKDENTTMMIFCNPHNPVGKMYQEDELTRIAKICADNNVIIISDEVHAGIIKPGLKHIPIAKVSDYKGIVTCTDFGKTFNLAALHICNVICEDPSVIMRLKMNGAAPASSSFGINAVKAAYLECDEWIENLNKHILSNKEYIYDFVNTHLPTVGFTVTDATYFGWFDFSGYNLSEEKVNSLIRKECNLVLENGAMFAKDYDKFQRMVLACPKETVVEAMNRIKRAFEKYEPNH